jgi:mono/diheme cytochrome c family protein
MAAKAFFLTMVGLLLLAVGAIIGRFSVDNSVPLLPTFVPLTPINYLDQINATRVPFGFNDATPTPAPTYTGSLAEGKVLYETLCAHCHGYTGGGPPGEPNPNIPDPIGFLPVPRHDSEGYTWLFPDQLLISFIKRGSNDAFYREVMPAYEDHLTDEEIFLILDYIKQWWTEEQREQQAAVTERVRIRRGE